MILLSEQAVTMKNLKVVGCSFDLVDVVLCFFNRRFPSFYGQILILPSFTYDFTVIVPKSIFLPRYLSRLGCTFRQGLVSPRSHAEPTSILLLQAQMATIHVLERLQSAFRYIITKAS